MTTTTLTDPRTALWERRRLEQERLVTLRIYRASVCGCLTCNDQAKATELDGHIRDCLARLATISDTICERQPTCSTPL